MRTHARTRSLTRTHAHTHPCAQSRTCSLRPGLCAEPFVLRRCLHSRARARHYCHRSASLSAHAPPAQHEQVLCIADSDSGDAPATGASAATAGAPHGTVARSTAPLRAPAETGLIAALRLDGFVHVARAYVPGVGWRDAYIPGDTARDTKPPQSPAGAATAVGGGAEAPRARPAEPAIKWVASAAYSAFRGWAASGGVRWALRRD